MCDCWLHARDVFLGINGCTQDLATGLRLASQCDHDEARWLCDVFMASGGLRSSLDRQSPPRSPEVARSILLLRKKSSAFSLALAALVVFPYRMDELRQAAEQGVALAQGFLARASQGPEKLTLALRAARQGDAQGMCVAAELQLSGVGEVAKREESLALLRRAAELGWVHAQVLYGATAFSVDQAERYVWLGRGGASCYSLLDEVEMQVERFDGPDGAGRRAIVYEIGKALCGHVKLARQQVFGRPVKQGGKLRTAVRAVALFEEWCQRARLAVECWMLVAKRVGVCKDVVGIVAAMVWQSRRIDS